MANGAGFSGTGAGAVRAAEAMLRAQGGETVRLMLPIPYGADAQQQALGLAAVEMEEVALGPAAVSCLTEMSGQQAQYELLLAATAVEQAAEARQIATGTELLRLARGVVHREKWLTLLSVQTSYCGGTAYLYRLRARERSDASS
jgi:hypothetical protein